MKKDKFIRIPNRKITLISSNLDFKRMLNKKIWIDYDRGTDGIGNGDGILREVYNDYVMLVSDNKEKYIPRNKILYIETRRR